MKSKTFEEGLRKIADILENYRIVIFQEEICKWEDDIKDKEYIDDNLFSLQSKIRDIATIVGLMNYQKDMETEQEKVNK